MNVRRIAIGVAIAAVLIQYGCAGRSDPAIENRWLRQAYDAHENLDMEARVLPAARSRALRIGDDLILMLSSGKPLTLHSDVSGCQDGTEHCDGFQLIADLPSRHFYFVAEYFYEGVNNYLIDDRTGHKTEIGTVPFFSPDNSRFLIQNDDVTSFHENNLEIWRREGDRAVLEWGMSLKEADTGISEEFGPPHTDLVSWQGDRITLSFSSQAWFDTVKKQTVPVRHWIGTLSHTADGWHLDARALRP